MVNLLENAYNMFMNMIQDLEIGNMIKDSDLCELWNLVYAYELIDSKLIGKKEQKQIIEYYG